MQTDTKQRLVNSASELIYSRSYSDVGVQAICEHAGVRKGSFYHFFPSKRDLTLAVLDQFHAHFSEQILDKAFDKSIPPLQRFERFFERVYDFQTQMRDSTGHVLGCPFGNLASEMSTQDEMIRARIGRIFSATEKTFELCLSEAVTNNDLPAIDTAATARALFAYVEGVIMYAKTQNDTEIIKELGKQALHLAIPARVG